jgi:hypothetical protein
LLKANAVIKSKPKNIMRPGLDRSKILKILIVRPLMDFCINPEEWMPIEYESQRTCGMNVRVAFSSFQFSEQREEIASF